MTTAHSIANILIDSAVAKWCGMERVTGTTAIWWWRSGPKEITLKIGILRQRSPCTPTVAVCVGGHQTIRLLIVCFTRFFPSSIDVGYVRDVAAAGFDHISSGGWPFTFRRIGVGDPVTTALESALVFIVHDIASSGGL